MITRAELQASLEEQGLPATAVEAVLKETASARHQWRVEQARKAALAAAHPEDHFGVGAALVLIADVLGVGGRDNCEGAATVRVPALADLGKGRKQATDGDAWSAAILAALRNMTEPRGVGVGVNGAGLVVRQWGAEGLEDGETVPAPDLPACWLRTVAREGLRQAVARDIPESGAQGRLEDWLRVSFAGSAAEWAEVVAGAEAAMAADRRESMDGTQIYDWNDCPPDGWVSVDDDDVAIWFASEDAAQENADGKGGTVISSNEPGPRPRSLGW